MSGLSRSEQSLVIRCALVELSLVADGLRPTLVSSMVGVDLYDVERGLSLTVTLGGAILFLIFGLVYTYEAVGFSVA